MASSIRIVIADDHTMVRSGLRMLLDAQPGFEVVGDAGDVDAAVARVRELRPHVVVIDLSMPGRSTLPAIPELRAAAPGVAVVVMTMHGEAAYAEEARAAGAAAFVRKEAADAELATAVRTAAAGGTYVDPLVSGAPVDLAVGEVWAGHRIEALGGRGGMGTVYRAHDLALDRVVALKVLNEELATDPVFRARFERECRLAAGVDHPRVVQVFHAGEQDGRLFATMRYVDGSDLRAILATERRLAPSVAVRLACQVAEALEAAHARGLVHRDVKPANVLVDVRQEGYLTDFGITKQQAVESDLTGTGVTMGTPDYLSPEQASGDAVDGRSDVYALGCVVHHALTGAPPFPAGGAVEKLWAHLHERPPSVLDVRPGLPPALGPVIERTLAKDPAARPASAADFAAELSGALG